jgi:hypothetical protein
MIHASYFAQQALAVFQVLAAGICVVLCHGSLQHHQNVCEGYAFMHSWLSVASTPVCWLVAFTQF